MPWARKQSAIPTISMRIRGKPVQPVQNWSESSMFLDDRQIKESAGHEQSLLPLPEFSRKIEGDSARRVLALLILSIKNEFIDSMTL